MSDPPTSQRNPTPWRWLAGAAIVFVLCAGGLVIWRLPLNTRSPEAVSEYAAAVAEVEATDPDWNWDRLNAARKRPPAGRNAADLIPKVRALTHRDWGKQLDSSAWAERVEQPPNVRYAPVVITEARRDLTESAGAVKLARTLKDLPHGHREVHLALNPIATLLPDPQHTRFVASVLRWDLAVALEEGNEQQAADDLMALLNTARSIGDEPYSISQIIRLSVQSAMVRSTERALAQTPGARDLSALQAALTTAGEEPLLLYVLRAERAINDRMFENVQNGSLALDALIDAKQQAEQGFGWERLYRARLPAERAHALRSATQFVELARRPVHEQLPRFAAQPYRPGDEDFLLSNTLLVLLGGHTDRCWRATAEVRCAVAGIACERFRQKHNRWPGALAELVPDFLPAVPLDPYNAEPLRYTKPNEGVVVSSVGRDLRDVDTLGPSDNKQARFRLWNPDQRRRPPPPEPAPEREPPP